MDDTEVRLRCIEAASKNPQHHPLGYAVGVEEAAQQWFRWIKGYHQQAVANKTLGLPKK